MNEHPNTILRDFDDYLMDGAGHVNANNDDNIIYNNQLYCYGNLSKQKFCCNNIFCCNKPLLQRKNFIVHCCDKVYGNGLLQQKFHCKKALLQ